MSQQFLQVLGTVTKKNKQVLETEKKSSGKLKTEQQSLPHVVWRLEFRQRSLSNQLKTILPRTKLRRIRNQVSTGSQSQRSKADKQ